MVGINGYGQGWNAVIMWRDGIVTLRQLDCNKLAKDRNGDTETIFNIIGVEVINKTNQNNKADL